MPNRQLADEDGHRWDIEDEGPTNDRNGSDHQTPHQLRFLRDDGEERVREAPQPLNQMADVELRALLAGEDPEEVRKGPDTESLGGGYGDAGD